MRFPGRDIPVRPYLQCKKCGSTYEGLVCLSCVKQLSLKWLRDRMAMAVEDPEVDLYWTKAGHLTLGEESWRRILRDLGLKPNSDLVIPTVCGVPVTWRDRSPMARDCSDKGLQLYFNVEEFKKCPGCASPPGTA